MNNLFKDIAPNLYAYRTRFFKSCGDTALLFIIPGIISFFFGMFFGVLLTVTRDDGIRPNKVIFRVIDILINIFRSIPFVILLIFLIPFTRAMVGTSIGVKGAIIPLVFGCVPFFTRQVETVLVNIDKGKIEAARSMGTEHGGDYTHSA